MERVDMNYFMGIEGIMVTTYKNSFHMPSGATRNIIQKPLLCATHMHMESIHTYNTNLSWVQYVKYTWNGSWHDWTENIANNGNQVHT